VLKNVVGVYYCFISQVHKWWCCHCVCNLCRAQQFYSLQTFLSDYNSFVFILMLHVLHCLHCGQKEQSGVWPLRCFFLSMLTCSLFFKFRQRDNKASKHNCLTNQFYMLSQLVPVPHHFGGGCSTYVSYCGPNFIHGVAFLLLLHPFNGPFSRTVLGLLLPLVIRHCWLGHLTHKNLPRYDL